MLGTYTDITLNDGILVISIAGIEKVMKAKVSPVEVHFPKGENFTIEFKMLETMGFVEREVMDEKEIAKEIGEEILDNIEFAKTISTFEEGVEKGLDIASGFVRRVCDLENGESTEF